MYVHAICFLLPPAGSLFHLCPKPVCPGLLPQKCANAQPRGGLYQSSRAACITWQNCKPAARAVVAGLVHTYSMLSLTNKYSDHNHRSPHALHGKPIICIVLFLSVDFFQPPTNKARAQTRNPRSNTFTKP